MKYLIEGPITPDVFNYLMTNLSARTDTGGHSIFLGQVRADVIKDKKVEAIEYSAYEAMVEIEAGKIKELILSEFSDARTIDIIHSTGIVRAGEISLLVLVSAGHRNHAIAACAKAVELIKENLPVWKKEIFDDQSHQWRQNMPT